ncbi:MAG: 3-oxoacyl-[acyl-carrier-protein] synthase [Polyangiaceae bacterium]|nr:3-oxoacyl-[acyl-carrier-protein] synthase [Polyangiaceae bacterium]
MHAKIAGLGQWRPEGVRRNEDWPAEFVLASKRRQGDRTLVDVPTEGEPDQHRAIVKRHLAAEEGDPFLGGKERRIAEAGASSAEAEALAGKAALVDAGVDGAELDAIFSWALVPDRLMPSNACRVAQRLGATRAWAGTTDTACASPVTQLTLAAALIESGRARTVLLTQSHLVSPTFPLMHPASPCVGDGATAMLVTASETPGILLTHSVTHGEYYDSVLWCRSKDSAADPPWWEAGGAFFMGSHDQASTRQLMQDTVKVGATTVHELAERARFDVREIAALASVQPRRWVPGAIAEGLGLSPEIAVDTYESYAHLGGAGAVANLLAARERGLLKAGALAVMYAQGAGFTRAAAAIRW